MVFVTGMGIISAIGKNTNEHLNHLRTGKTGIKKAVFFQSKYSKDVLFGEVGLSTEDILSISNLANNKELTRTDALAHKAFGEAVEDARLSSAELSKPYTAFISAGTVGGMCAHHALYNDATKTEKSSKHLNAYQFASHTLSIINRYKLKGFSNTINTACSSSANAIMFGSMLILSGRAQRVIVGGTDALSKYTVNGFNALRILSDTPCMPFDKKRKGLTLGEGAAYLVLENESLAKSKNKYAAVSGFGNSNDTFHPSSLGEDAQGVIKAMQNALTNSIISPDNIDYINTHGTATENNDKVELLGMTEVFKKLPFYNATKSYTGHTLGAAGAVEAIFSILSLYHNEIYPSLHCEAPIDPSQPPVTKYKKGVRLRNALSNSFGFGGNCTSLIFSKI